MSKKTMFSFYCQPAFGKSVCFPTLPFLFDHKLGMIGGQKSSIILVSPLIALMGRGQKFEGLWC